MAVPARVITKAQRGSNFGTVAGALVQTVARSAREEPQASGWRAHGRKCLPAGVQARRVPGRMLACWSNGVFGTCGPRGGRQSPIELACLRQSPIEQALHGRDAHECVQHPGATAHSVRTENVEDSPLSIQRSQSAGWVRRRSAKREGSHSSKDGNPFG